jgi:mono/diheme cytochrome c family protein
MRRLACGVLPGLLLAGCISAGFQLFSQDEKVPNDIIIKKNPVVSSDAVLAKAKKVYEENCLTCHGENGKGDGPMAGMLKERPADLTNAALVGPLTDGQVYWAITKGRKPSMTEFESKLSVDERWSQVLFIRTFSKTKPNNTPPAGK